MNKGTIIKNDNVKTILIIVLVVLCLLLIGAIYYSIHIYQTINTTKNSELNKTKTTLINDNVMAEINEMYDFHDEKSYHIFKGKNNDGIEQFVFVSLDDDNKQIIIDVDDTISKQQAIDKSTKDCQQCKVVKTNPAMIGNLSLWEIIYYDDNERYVINYISMKNGQQIEQLRLVSKYKQ